MALNGVYAHTWGRANFQSGGDLTTSGKVNRWQVDNRPSAGSSYNGWYQDEEWVNYTMVTGYQGVNLGALGGHLRLNGTNVYAYSGTASLQALGDVVLEAAMTDKVHAATSTGSFIIFRRSQLERPVTRRKSFCKLAKHDNS